MDCAKAVGARIARPDKTLYEMSGILKVLRKPPLMIAVPSIAGTGSEATLAAVKAVKYIFQISRKRRCM